VGNPVVLPDSAVAVVGIHPGLVLHHPAAVQRLHQGIGRRRGGAAETHSAAENLRREHDRHEADMWRWRLTR